MNLLKHILLRTSVVGMSALLMPAYADEFPVRERGRDLLINAGSSSAHKYLGYGWSHGERYGEQQVRWINRLEGDIVFNAHRPGDYLLWVRAAPLYLQNRQQNIGVYLNDHFLTEWVCPHDDTYHAYHVALPEEWLVPQGNRLTFRMGYCRQIPGDRRTLSLRVDDLLIRKAEP